MKKSTMIRSLLMSGLSVLLCVSMLMGSTFAWFTDSVESGINTIVAGNLDVELYNGLDNTADKVNTSTELFDIDFWEPGAMVYENLTVANEGTLALKYALSVKFANATTNANGDTLAEVLKVAVVPDGIADGTERAELEALDSYQPLASFVENGELIAGESATYGIVIWWEPSDIDNDFNMNNENKGKFMSIDLGVALFATQMAYEEDSFGDDYDADAPMKPADVWDGSVDEDLTDAKDETAKTLTIATAEELAAFAAEVNAGTDYKGWTVTLAANIDLANKAWTPIGTNLSACFKGTFDGAGYTIFNLNVEGDINVGLFGYAANGGNVKNLTVQGATVKANDYAGAIMGRGYTDIVNCNVIDATVTVTPYMKADNSGYDGGAKAGAVIGQLLEGAGNTVVGCTATNFVIAGYRDLGGVVGMASSNNSVSGCSAKNVTIHSIACNDYADGTPAGNFGAIVGRINSSATVDFTAEENAAYASVIVVDPETAQAALDNAVAGTTIQLAPGADYGTLYLRPVAGSPATATVDWIGNNYGWETYTLFEDITILGADGATIDAIKIEGGTYYHTEHSQDDAYPVMLSLVELKNVVIDGVTFTGNGGYDPQGYGNAINLSGNNIKVDGLTLKNCVLENEANNARLIYKTESTSHVHNYAYNGENFTFVPSLKNITVTGCTFNGGYMGLELRETENLTITNNTFNVADRNILLPTNTGCTYSGTITITGNVSNNAKERFVRADGMGDAVVVIKDNTLNNYMGADADYIKVTNANNVTTENNIITYGAKDNATFANALKIASDGSTITLLSGGDYSLLAIPKGASAKNITVKAEEGVKVGAVYQIGCGYCTGGILAMPENLTFDGITFDGQIGELANGNFCTCTHAITDINGLSGFLTRWSKANGLTFKDCEFVNGAAISLSYGGSKNLVVDGCTFKDTVSSAVSAYATNGVTVTGCTMENIGFAAIFAGDESQNIVFENNTVTSTGSRIIRLNKLTTGTTVTVKGNTFGVANTDPAEAADNNGQIVKISASVSANVTFEDNTYNDAAFPEVITTDNANWVAVAN